MRGPEPAHAGTPGSAAGPCPCTVSTPGLDSDPANLPHLAPSPAPLPPARVFRAPPTGETSAGPARRHVHPAWRACRWAPWGAGRGRGASGAPAVRAGPDPGVAVWGRGQPRAWQSGGGARPGAWQSGGGSQPGRGRSGAGSARGVGGRGRGRPPRTRDRPPQADTCRVGVGLGPSSGPAPSRAFSSAFPGVRKGRSPRVRLSASPWSGQPPGASGGCSRAPGAPARRAWGAEGCPLRETGSRQEDRAFGGT